MLPRRLCACAQPETEVTCAHAPGFSRSEEHYIYLQGSLRNVGRKRETQIQTGELQNIVLTVFLKYLHYFPNVTFQFVRDENNGDSGVYNQLCML